MAWRLLLHSWCRRAESLSLPSRPDLYTLNLRVSECVYSLFWWESVGGERPSFVLLSPSVHAATVNRYTAACMESKEDEEAWRSARERKRASAQLTSWVPECVCVLSTTSSCTTMHTQNAPLYTNTYIFPPGCFLVLSPAPRCAHALLVCLELAHWQFCLIVCRTGLLSVTLDHANGRRFEYIIAARCPKSRFDKCRREVAERTQTLVNMQPATHWRPPAWVSCSDLLY